ncbi:MAG: hypothetical protein A2X94_03780 [Bdellovibrionales bacterium GWB1_55_8]|nr:MAG: hypothetical protein A2X94_03780 [Bdellovibrionales bacterium GWB1_55_8]
MKRTQILLTAVALTAGSVIAIASTAPDSVTLKAKNGNITFNHKAHGQKTSCSTCHGETIGKLAPLGMAKGHKMCQECHKAQGVGPQKCGDCHKK